MSSQRTRERYRSRWRWDTVGKSTHLLNCWYQRNCAYNVYVKDGVARWEEQSAEYPRTNPSVPDFNPRGCEKGSCYALQSAGSTRVTRPLKRVGERGEGNWEEVSWEDALTDIADRVITPGDLVEASNDVGRFRVRAKVSPCVQPGQVIVHHAWEEFQFPGGAGQRSVTASPINLVELAGDYFHIRPAPAVLQPGQNDRDTRVEVTRVPSPSNRRAAGTDTRG